MMAEIAALRRRQIAAAIAATEVYADRILGEAQRIAPLEEGTLRGSGDRETERTANGATVTIFFATPYAARQHEELGWQHQHGQAKYLEAPFKAHVPGFEAFVGRAVAAVTR